MVRMSAPKILPVEILAPDDLALDPVTAPPIDAEPIELTSDPDAAGNDAPADASGDQPADAVTDDTADTNPDGIETLAIDLPSNDAVVVTDKTVGPLVYDLISADAAGPADVSSVIEVPVADPEPADKNLPGPAVDVIAVLPENPETPVADDQDHGNEGFDHFFGGATMSLMRMADPALDTDAAAIDVAPDDGGDQGLLIDDGMVLIDDGDPSLMTAICVMMPGDGFMVVDDSNLAVMDPKIVIDDGDPATMGPGILIDDCDPAIMIDVLLVAGADDILT